MINEYLIKAAIDEDRALVEEELAAAADNAGSSAAQMGLKDLEAQLGEVLFETECCSFWLIPNCGAWCVRHRSRRFALRLSSRLAGRKPIWEELTHDKLTTLTLSYRSLAAIANLDSLVSLRTLRLDNNSIRAIEGLSALTQLTWLDLSFNEIEVRWCLLHSRRRSLS